jgi:hypothetical protein
VQNKSKQEQIVDLTTDAVTEVYKKTELNEEYGANEYGVVNDDDIENSEVKHNCWFIENPITKDLTKRITLKLGPRCE